MSTELSKYAETQNVAAEFGRLKEVREYVSLMGDFPARMQTALGDLEKLTPSLEKFIAAKLREFPRNPNYPPALRNEVESLHVNYFKPGRERLGSAGTAARIRALLDKIDHVKPQEFVSHAPSTLALYDRERAGSLLSEAKWLRELPETIERVEPEIRHLTEVWAGREYVPDRATVVGRQPKDENKQLDKFDPRQT